MSINLKRIETAQHFLERELVTNKLVSLVRREPPSGWVDTGRYHFLWKALKQDNQLLEALRLEQEWASSALGTTVLPTAVLPTSIRIEGLSGGRIGRKDLIPEGVALPAEGHFTFHVMENPGYVIIPLVQGDHVIKEIRADIDPTLPSGTTIDFHIMVYEQGFITYKGKIGDHEFVASLETPEMQVSLQVTNTDQFRWFENQWQEFAHTYAASDPAFLHGIALMHWEWALEFDNGDRDEDNEFDLATHHYQRAKYYWTHLLGRQGYWQSFSSKPYYQGEEAPEDVSVKLHHQVSQELLQHHYNRCRTSFNNGNLEAAVFHLKCLCNWNILMDETCSGMYDEPLLEQEWDQAALGTVDEEAERIFRGWVSEWLARANDVLDDPNVDLPRGISKNYEGALDAMRLYLELVPYNPRLFQRVLLFVLRQANGWCYETAIAGDQETALPIIEGVKPIIERLESLWDKPASNAVATPDNKVLSTSYALWAQLVDDIEIAQAYANAAAEWDPGDRHAGELRDQMSRLGVRVRLDQAQECLEAKEFQKALEILKGIDLKKHPGAKETVRSLTAVTHFQWAMYHAELANQETEDLLEKGIIRDIEKTTQMRNAVRQLEQAKDHMALALEYEPEHPALTENLQALEHEVKYRPFGIKMGIGIDFFEKDEYDNALVALEGSFPEDFPGSDTVLQVRAGCFFRRAIQRANNERFDDAVEDMRRARDLVPDNETVQAQLAELEQIRKDFPYLKAMREAESLLEKERYQDALNAMRDVPRSFRGYERVRSMRAACEFHLGIQCVNDGNFSKSVEHLERAAKLDPDEPVIQKQLAIARRMLTDAPHIEAVREAQALMKKERYEDALRAMRDIPRSFGDYQGVQRLKAVCEFNLGIQCANSKNLSQAIQHLEQAEMYDPNEPAIKKQLSELRTIEMMGGFAAIERRNRAHRKAQEVVNVLNAAGPSNPLTPQKGYELLMKLQEAVDESGGDPQIVALRDQLKNALSGHSRY